MVRIEKSSDGYSLDDAVLDNESFFTYVDLMGFGGLYYKVEEALSNIDKAVVIDKETCKIETPFGVCDISEISTGCKTVLNYLWVISHRNEFKNIRAISATESGANAIEVLFEYIEDIGDDTMSVILEHRDELGVCKNREYLINGTEVVYDIDFM